MQTKTFLMNLALVGALGFGCGPGSVEEEPASAPPPPSETEPVVSVEATEPACETWTEEQVAKILDVDVSDISEADGPATEFGQEGVSDCQWSVSDGEVMTEVTLYYRAKTSAMKGPDPIAARIKSLIRSGAPEVSSEPTSYYGAQLGGRQGALSKAFSTQYANGLAFAWSDRGKRFVKVTLLHTQEDLEVELTSPEKKTLERFVRAVR